MFPLTVALGVSVVVAILASPVYVERFRPAGSVRLGTAFVVGSIGLASLAASVPRASLPAADAVFLGCYALLLVGALLILRGDSGEGRGDDTDPDPPWWPEFETGFRRHLQREARRRVPSR